MKKCIPIMANRIEECVALLYEAMSSGCDLIEWRVDCLNENIKSDIVLDTWKTIKEIATVPIIITLRTEREGGNKDMYITDYNQAIVQIVNKMQPEYMDLELMSCGGDATAHMLIRMAHKKGIKVIVSMHDMLFTTDARDIEMMLCRMKYIGADIPKIATMANSKKDVEELMKGAKAASEQIGELIAISMGELGKETRIKGKEFGSVITFLKPIGSGYNNENSIGQLTEDEMERENYGKDN